MPQDGRLPTEPAPLPVGGGADTFEDRRSGIENFLATPEVQAGLLQFAVSVLQPGAPGQRPVARIAQSVAQGAEAAGRVRSARREREQTAFAQGISERETKVEEERVAAAKAQVDVDKSRVSTLAREIEQRREQALQERDVRLRGQDLVLIQSLINAEAAQARALVTQASDPFLTDPNQRAALLERASRGLDLSEIELLSNGILALVEGNRVGASFPEVSVRSLLEKSSRAGQLERTERKLREMGVSEEVLQRSMEGLARQPTTTPAPVSPTTPGAPAETGKTRGSVVTQRLQAIADFQPPSGDSFSAQRKISAANAEIDEIPSVDVLSDTDIEVINSDPTLRAVARLKWGDRFDQRVQGLARRGSGIFGRPGDSGLDVDVEPQ